MDPVSKANGVFIGGRLQAARRWSGGGRFIFQSKPMGKSHAGGGRKLERELERELERRPVPVKIRFREIWHIQTNGPDEAKNEVSLTGISDPSSTSLGNIAVMGQIVANPGQYRQRTRRTLRVTRRVLRVCSNLKRFFCMELHLSHLSGKPWVCRCECRPLWTGTTQP